ncbi:Protein CBG27562 [Caenorhabditis briggsae]|uniref:Uncharacterized protein n=2 Tax=Caenorhabditis briggsae TaxID=6238 RepID=A0AAE8ZR58_CAEBR|nr:Protein CBG27562 [Caenorhabditis briggsae]ULT81128.1 hypothetical protein L3Y34_011188 [Caenorhabditis briggsae]CAS00455.1 Protein CBG27562 [Caenorhabditis briggsae]
MIFDRIWDPIRRVFGGQRQRVNVYPEQELYNTERQAFMALYSLYQSTVNDLRGHRNPAAKETIKNFDDEAYPIIFAGFARTYNYEEMLNLRIALQNIVIRIGIKVREIDLILGVNDMNALRRLLGPAPYDPERELRGQVAEELKKGRNGINDLSGLVFRQPLAYQKRRKDRCSALAAIVESNGNQSDLTLSTRHDDLKTVNADIEFFKARMESDKIGYIAAWRQAWRKYWIRRAVRIERERRRREWELIENGVTPVDQIKFYY